MLHEEFTSLSKVETTAKFYKETIEPLYTKMNVEKDEFVEQWLKDNKANIVRAHAFDIDRATRELSLTECKTDELAKIKAENSRLQYQAETLETKYKAVYENSENQKRWGEDWKKSYYEASERANQLEPLKEKIADLEKEIIRLKARLFDMMDNGVDVRPNIAEIATCELVEELKTREGVKTKTAVPYEDLTVTVNGPAIVFVVID